MPIRGVTEHPNIPRLGKIRLGVKDEDRGFPKNVDHFVVPEEVAKALGEDEPKELHIIFLSDDLDRIASQYYRAYNGSSGLICKGDGYNADALLDAEELRASGGDLTIEAWAHGQNGHKKATKDVVRKQIHCAGSGVDGEAPCPMFVAKKCGIRTFMQFAIRDVPGLGVYQMDTGSVINTRNVNGAIELARLMLGGVAGVPFILRREQLEVAPDGKKKKIWGVSLQVDTEYSLGNLLEMRRGPIAAAFLPEGSAIALLPPVDETEVYEAIEDDEDEQPPEEPAPPEPPANLLAPSDILTEIAKKYGNDRAVKAKGIMPYLYGTADLLKLKNDDRADFRDRLLVWLNEPDHKHELAYGPDGRACCGRCGVEVEEQDFADDAVQSSLGVD